MKEMNIPVGVSDFEEIRKNEYYYIDKSELIGESLQQNGDKSNAYYPSPALRQDWA